MMMIEERGRSAGRGTLQAFESSIDVVGGFDRLVDRRHSQRRNRAVAVAVAVVVAVLTVFAVQGTWSADTRPEPMEPIPGFEVGDVPVWYDDAGLHRGDVVEQTPVELREMDGDGALVLVRTGALYLDPATDDIWFHPWGGEPRIVGRSLEGLGGDPNGDTAAWFEGSELVLYDTAVGREVSRTRLPPPYPGGTFVEVSAEHVAWGGHDTGFLGRGGIVFDTRSGEDSVIKRDLVDRHNENMLSVSSIDRLVMTFPGRDPAHGFGTCCHKRYDEFWHHGLFSAAGNHVLTSLADVSERSIAILDVRSGEVWRLPDGAWTLLYGPPYAWSYSDTALVTTNEGLLSCDVSERTCEQIPVEGTVLMPTS